MKKRKRHVGCINQDYLCMGCGACVAVCPADAVAMRFYRGQFFPVVDEGRCIDCGKCIRVCPGISVRTKTTADTFWPENERSFKIGRFKKTYAGWSTDRQRRFNASSGGITTEIARYLLRENLVDGVVVTGASQENPLKGHSFIAHNEDEVAGAQTSKYCAASPVAALEFLRKSEKAQRVACIGLPCHIHGIRNLQELERWARERIVFTIGLLCGHGVSSLGLACVLERMAEGTEGIAAMKHRGRGWPGSLSVTYESGQTYSIAHTEYWPPFFAPYFFTPLRCLACHDLTSELADVSCGDAWLKDYQKEENPGVSLVIARSQPAQQYIAALAQQQKIVLEEIPVSDAVTSQAGALERKKKGTGSRIRLFQLCLKPIPRYDVVLPVSTKGLLGACLVFFNAIISRVPVGKGWIQSLSKKVLLRYCSYIFRLSR